MGIIVGCSCGANYDLKDEWAGKAVRCTKCNATLQVPAAAAPAAAAPPPLDDVARQMVDYIRQNQEQFKAEDLRANLIQNGYSAEQVDKAFQYAASGASTEAAAGGAQAGYGEGVDPAFQRDKFLLKQKHFAISEKYVVWDEEGGELLYIERPAHLLLNIAAIFAGLAAFGAVVFGCFHLFSLLPRDTSGGVALIVLLLMAAASFSAAFFAWLAVVPLRHVTFFRDENKSECLLKVSQDQKFAFFTMTYTIRTPNDEVLGVLHKNYLYNVFRKRWYIFRPDGSLWCLVLEDSIILSLLRRFLGSFYGLLRSNFIIQWENTEDVIGEFNRKFTILDRYVLDVSRDGQHRLDRRVACALGVMLDTGERR